MRLRAVPIGVTGTLAMTAGAFSYARIPTGGRVAGVDLLGDFRSSPHPERTGLLLCYAGLFLLVAAWLLLGAQVRRGTVDLPGVRRAAWWWVLPLLVAPPMFSGDGWSYAADAHLLGRGMSPYLQTPAVLHGPIVDAVCGCWRGTTAPYGPLGVLWGGGYAHFTTSPWLLMFSYRALAVIGLGLLMAAVRRLAGLTRMSPEAATWLAVASPFTLAVGVGGAHLDLFMIGLAALGVALTPTRGWLVGAVLVGGAAAVKAPAIAAALGVVLLSASSSTILGRAWHALKVIAVAAGVVVVTGGVGGLGLGWLRGLHNAVGLHTPLSLTYDATRISDLLGLRPAVVDGAAVVAIAIILAGLGWRTPVGPRAVVVRALALAMLAVTLLSPVTNEWYFLWCLPLLAAAHLRPRWWHTSVAIHVALALIAPLDPSLHVPGAKAVVLIAMPAALVLGASWTRLSGLGRRRPPAVPATPPATAALPPPSG